MKTTRALVGTAVALAMVVGGRVAADEQTADELVAKFLAAKGGVEKLRAVQTVKITSTIVAPSAPPDARMTTWTMRPNMIRREQSGQGQTMVIGFDGTTVWVSNPVMKGVREVTGPQADATRKGAGEFDSLLLDYQKKGHIVELEGQETAGGRQLYKLKVTSKDGSVQHVFLDAQTFLEAKVVTTVDRPGAAGEPAGRAELTTEFSNYQQVDGLAVPFTVRQSVGGELAATMTVQQVEFNVPMEASFFQMPAK